MSAIEIAANVAKSGWCAD